MSNPDTQVISALSYNVNDMIFSPPVISNIPDSKLTSKRIHISTKNPDGTIGELCMSTGQIYSFGLNVNEDQKSKEVIGYSMPLCLFNKNGPSAEEKAFVDKMNEIVEKCKDHIIENKDELEQFTLEKSELKKINNSLYYKRDPKNKAKILDGVGPTLYAKLMYDKKKNKITTDFFNEVTGELMNPMELMEKHCYATACIKFESIFIGNKISMQIKLIECGIKPIDSGRKHLLPRPVPTSSVVEVKTSTQSSALLSDNEDENLNDVSLNQDEDDAGSLKNEPIVEQPKKVIKKVVKVVKKEK